MAKKKEGAEGAAAEAPKYPGLSAGFMRPNATFQGRVKSVYDSWIESGKDANNQKAQSFRAALSDGAIPGPTERVTRKTAEMCEALGIGLPAELLPEVKTEAAPAPEAPAAADDSVTSAV